MMAHNRVFRPGQSGGPRSTFNISIPQDKDIYISDSDSDSDSDEPCSDKPDALSGPSSPSGSSTATIETMAETPNGNPARGSASASPFAVTSVGCQTPPPSILKDSRLSFSVTWASNEDEQRGRDTRTGAPSVAGAEADADVDAAATTTRAGNRKEPSPREFLLRCPPGPGDRLEDVGKIARVAEFCQHPVLACFMYTALAVDAAIGVNKQELPPVESPPAQPSAAAPPAGSSVETMPVESSPAVVPSNQSPTASLAAAASSAAAAAAASPVASPVATPAESHPVAESSGTEASGAPPAVPTVASPVESLLEAPVEPGAPPPPPPPAAAEQSSAGQGQSSEGGSSSKGKVEGSPRAHRGWGLAKGVAAVAIGVAIGATLVWKRR